MQRVMRVGANLLFVAVMYLILTAVLSPWIELPGLGNVGFTLIFVLFSTVHCAASIGWKRTGIFFALAASVSYVMEEIGVRTGWIYGAYHYSGMLGPRLGHVPLIIPLAWFMMIYPAWRVAKALLRGLDTDSPAGLASVALIAALVMTAWDVVMDPGMAAAGNWVWESGGSYFGVPLHNYFGWMLTTFTVYLGAGVLWNDERVLEKAGSAFAALPIVVYTFYGLSYTVPRSIPQLQVVALFAMVMPGLLALMQAGLRQRALAPPPRSTLINE